MPSENVEVVRRVYDAVARRDVDAILALYDPAVEIHAGATAAGELFGREIYRGHEGLREFDREWRDTFADVETECEDLIEAGDRVVSVARYHVRGRLSGIEVAGPARAGVWTVHDGKVTRVVWFDTLAEALAGVDVGRPTGSPETLELARRVMRTLGERDGDALVALADPDVEWHSFFALGGVYRGHQGTRQYMRDLSDAWEVGSAEVDDALAVGDVVLLVGRIHYRGKGSGAESTNPAGWTLQFRDGKVLRFRAFRDPEATIATLGAGS